MGDITVGFLVLAYQVTGRYRIIAEVLLPCQTEIVNVVNYIAVAFRISEHCSCYAGERKLVVPRWVFTYSGKESGRRICSSQDPLQNIETTVAKFSSNPDSETQLKTLLPEITSAFGVNEWAGPARG